MWVGLVWVVFELINEEWSLWFVVSLEDWIVFLGVWWFVKEWFWDWLFCFLWYGCVLGGICKVSVI